jgi:hypothetical protein
MMTSDIARLTMITTTSGSAARVTGGVMSVMAPCAISAGSNSRAVVARSRSTSSAASRSVGIGVPSPKPSPLALAFASSRLGHHSPKPSMISDARRPRPGAANGVVPKNGIGIAF